MAGLEELANLLAVGAAQKKEIAASDPYLQFQQAPDAISSLIMQSATNPKYSTKEKVIAGLLSGLTSGVFGGLSNDYQARAGQAYGDVVSGTAQGNTMERPSVLSPSVFQSAQQQGSIFTANRLAQQLERQQKIEDIGLSERAKKLGELGAYETIPGGGGLLNPALKAIAAEEDAQKAALLKSGPGAAFDAIASALPGIKEMAQDDSGTSDNAYAMLLIKSMGGGVVNEGERVAVEGTASGLQRVKGSLERILNGGSKLTVAEKVKGLKELQDMAKNQYSAFKQYAEPGLLTAESRGGARKNILPYSEDYVNALLEPVPEQPSVLPVPSGITQQIQSQLPTGVTITGVKRIN
jgi:hypothetical protein